MLQNYAIINVYKQNRETNQKGTDMLGWSQSLASSLDLCLFILYMDILVKERKMCKKEKKGHKFSHPGTSKQYKVLQYLKKCLSVPLCISCVLPGGPAPPLWVPLP